MNRYDNKAGGRAGHVKHYGNHSQTRCAINATGKELKPGTIAIYADGKIIAAGSTGDGVQVAITAEYLTAPYPAEAQCVNYCTLQAGEEVVLRGVGSIGKSVEIDADGTVKGEGESNYIAVAVDGDLGLTRVKRA